MNASEQGNSGAPAPRNGVGDIKAYVQGKSELAGKSEPIKLSSNESPWGPSPAAIEAYRNEAAQLHRYPDGSQAALRTAIGEVHGLDSQRIVCGNGSEELIGLVTRAYLAPGDQMLLSQNHFVMCPIYGRAQGGEVIMAAERHHRTDVDAMIAAITDKTRLVIVANPNNPTGTYLTADEIAKLYAAVPARAIMILDNAYAEYVHASDYSRGFDLAESAENLVVTHTLSKIYGLAGLRIGWAYCPGSVGEALNRIRTPFNTNRAALAAATAAIRDQDYMRDISRLNAEELARITDALGTLGIDVVPSVTNFYLLNFAGVEGRDGAGAGEFLESRGIIPRPGGDRDYLRITVGLPAENDAVIAALAQYMSG